MQSSISFAYGMTLLFQFGHSLSIQFIIFVYKYFLSRNSHLGIGELIAATFKDRNGREALISGSPLEWNSPWPQLTTQRDSMNLNGMSIFVLLPTLFL